MSALLPTISRGKRLRHIFALIYGTDGAIRAFYGLKDKGKEEAKGKTQPTAKDVQKDSKRPLLTKVRKRLEEDGISELEFLSQGRFRRGLARCAKARQGKGRVV